MIKLSNAFVFALVSLSPLSVLGLFQSGLLNPAPAPTVTDPAQNTPAPPVDSTGYDIWVSYSEDPSWLVPNEIAQNIDAAETKWRTVITGDLPGVVSGVVTTPSANNQFGTCPVPGGSSGVIDDLFICASAYYDATSSGVAAAAVATVRSGSLLPFISVMRYNRYYLGRQTSLDITNVLTHEMGHALGIGTTWVDLNLSTSNVRPCSYRGTNANAKFRQLSGCTGDIPLEESTGNAGSDCGHWDEDCVNTELMSPFVEDSGTAMPLSEITVGALDDMGYTVNYNGADAFGKALFTGECVCNRRRRHHHRFLGEENDKAKAKQRRRRRMNNDAYMSALEDAKQILRDLQAESVLFEGVGDQVQSVVGNAVAYMYHDAEDDSFRSLVVTKDDLVA